MPLRKVCRVEELPVGERLVIEGGKHGIGLFNHGGTVYALNNYCPHAGAPVCLGPITGTTESQRSYDATWIRSGEILRCPWHGWEFDLASGTTIMEPVRRVKMYPVAIEDGWISIDD